MPGVGESSMVLASFVREMVGAVASSRPATALEAWDCRKKLPEMKASVKLKSEMAAATIETLESFLFNFSNPYFITVN